jgi:hypothetical protein
VKREEVLVGGGVVIVTAGTATAAAVTAHNALAPILAFVGVILVALLTAYFTKRRQEDQLLAERDRQDAALVAENERLQHQLAHDRQLHDLAELRSVIDEALQNAEVAKNWFLDCQRVGLRPTFDAAVYGGVYDALQQALRPLAMSYVRVVTRGHEPLALALHEMREALAVPTCNMQTTPEEQKREAWKQAADRLTAKHALVINLARALVASDLPSSG